MRKKDYSFRGIKFGGKVFVSTLLVLLVVFALSIVIGAYFFGFVGFFNLVNVEYESFGSLFLFILFFFIFGHITDLFAQAFLVVLLNYYKDKKKRITLRIIIETLFAWLAIFVVDEMMPSITIPVETELIIVFVLVLADLVFDGKKKSRKKKKG